MSTPRVDPPTRAVDDQERPPSRPSHGLRYSIVVVLVALLGWWGWSSLDGRAPTPAELRAQRLMALNTCTTELEELLGLVGTAGDETVDSLDAAVTRCRDAAQAPGQGGVRLRQSLEDIATTTATVRDCVSETDELAGVCEEQWRGFIDALEEFVTAPGIDASIDHFVEDDHPAMELLPW